MIIGGSTVDNGILLDMLRSHEIFNPSPNATYLTYMLIGAIVTSWESGAIFQSIGAQCANLDFLQSPGDDVDSNPILLLSYPITAPKFEVISFGFGEKAENVNNRLKTYLYRKLDIDTLIKHRSIVISDDNNLISFNVSDTLYITQAFRREFVRGISLTNCRHENNAYILCNKFDNDVGFVADCMRKYLTTIARGFLKLIELDAEFPLFIFSFENIEAYITGAMSMGNYRLMNLSRVDQRLPPNVNLNFIYKLSNEQNDYIPVWITFRKVDNLEAYRRYHNTAIKWVIVCRIAVSTINDSFSSVGVTVRKININHGLLDQMAADVLLGGIPSEKIDLITKFGKLHSMKTPSDTICLILGDILRQHESSNDHTWSIFVADDTMMFAKIVKKNAITICCTVTGTMDLNITRTRGTELTNSNQFRSKCLGNRPSRVRRFYDEINVKRFKQEIEKARLSSYKKLFSSLQSIGNRILPPDLFNRTAFMHGYMLQDCSELNLINENRLTCMLGPKTTKKLDVLVHETFENLSDCSVVGLVHLEHFIDTFLNSKTNPDTITVSVFAQKNETDFSAEVSENHKTLTEHNHCFKITQRNENMKIYLKSVLDCIDSKKRTLKVSDANNLKITGKKYDTNINKKLNQIDLTKYTNINVSLSLGIAKFISEACYETSIVYGLQSGLRFNLNPKTFAMILNKKLKINRYSAEVALTPARNYLSLHFLLATPLLYKMPQVWFQLPKKILHDILEQENVEEPDPECMLGGAQFSRDLSTAYHEFIVFKHQFVSEKHLQSLLVNQEFATVSLHEIKGLNFSRLNFLSSVLNVRLGEQEKSQRTLAVPKKTSLKFKDGRLTLDPCGNMLMRVDKLPSCNGKHKDMAQFTETCERLRLPAIIHCKASKKVIVPNFRRTTSEHAIIQLPAVNNSICNTSNIQADALISVEFSRLFDKSHMLRPFSLGVIPSKTQTTIIHFDFWAQKNITLSNRFISILKTQMGVHFMFNYANQLITFNVCFPLRSYASMVFVYQASHRIEQFNYGTINETGVRLVQNPIIVPDWLEIVIVDSSLIGTEMMLGHDFSSCGLYRFADTIVISNSLVDDETKTVSSPAITVVFPKSSLDLERIDPTVLKFDDQKVIIRKAKSSDKFVDITVSGY